MLTEREIALEQALIVVLGAAEEIGVDLKTLTDKASALILDSSKYRFVDHPHVSNTGLEISLAYAKLRSLG